MALIPFFELSRENFRKLSFYMIEAIQRRSLGYIVTDFYGTKAYTVSFEVVSEYSPNNVYISRVHVFREDGSLITNFVPTPYVRQLQDRNIEPEEDFWERIANLPYIVSSIVDGFYAETYFVAELLNVSVPGVFVQVP